MKTKPSHSKEKEDFYKLCSFSIEANHRKYERTKSRQADARQFSSSDGSDTRMSVAPAADSACMT